ncbi:hypothetical protein [Vallicoccus soli]|uniref:Uncharacterized protein n=1 Tax=Vallicoccus soli TaxID=2339232 RepID=A0A3A3ZN84_9ACTN|nr:hypothetical protein [Vallicoccus soli]RJK98265.1 hypothetical protein D5H78_05085 [Vallicoccus soli]
MDAATLQATDAFLVRQRITAMVNRYDVSAARPDWSAGEPVAFAQQKRMALREQITLYTDESRRAELCAFRARQVMDVRAQYDVTAPDGTVIGGFRKDFARSLLVSTFHLEQAGGPAATGSERNLLVALLRRVSDVPLAVHFDFTTVEGEPVLSSERTWGLRDAYRVSVHAPWLDRRLALSLAIGLDALLAR